MQKLGKKESTSADRIGAIFIRRVFMGDWIGQGYVLKIGENDYPNPISSSVK
jgi:hypothetical protein